MNGGIIGKTRTARLGLLDAGDTAILTTTGYRRQVLDLSQDVLAGVGCGTYDPTSDVFTINAWVYLIDFSHDYNCVVAKRSGNWSLANSRFWVGLTDAGTQRYVQAAIWYGGALETKPYSMPFGSWVNLTWTRASGGAGTYRLNGSGAYVFTGGTSIGLGTGSGTNLRIGNTPIADGSVTEAFYGYIANLSIWDVALTQDQVKTLMQTRLRGNETNLKCYWPLDGDAVDRTGNASGTLDNNARFITVADFPVAA